VNIRRKGKCKKRKKGIPRSKLTPQKKKKKPPTRHGKTRFFKGRKIRKNGYQRSYLTSDSTERKRHVREKESKLTRELPTSGGNEKRTDDRAGRGGVPKTKRRGVRLMGREV